MNREQAEARFSAMDPVEKGCSVLCSCFSCAFTVVFTVYLGIYAFNNPDKQAYYGIVDGQQSLIADSES